MIKNQKSQKGYTLVELLAVIAVVIVVGVIISGILVSSLRGGSKSNVLDNVRQNGNNAIAQMSKMILYAQYFNGVSTNGQFFTTNCTQAPVVSPSPTPAPVNFKYLKITSFDGHQTIFSCSNTDSITGDVTISSGSASLIDNSTVVLDTCSFSCLQNNIGQPAIIGINFTLSQKTSSTFSEKKATIPFYTSITIRNNNL